MRILFEDESETKTFLELCRLIGKVLEENEKFKS
jgi:hypothetical protein